MFLMKRFKAFLQFATINRRNAALLGQKVSTQPHRQEANLRLRLAA